jgi:hypothetical protein
MLPATGCAVSAQYPGDGLLPDLVAAPPQMLSVETGENGHFLLGFRWAGENIGAGPLILEGTRAPDSPVMFVEKLIVSLDGSIERRPVTATMHYRQSQDHSHWHYDDLITYELYDATRGNLAAPAHKTGFCLGDRFDAVFEPTGEPATPFYTGNCELDAPSAIRVTEGISISHGDHYPPFLEGQSIDVAACRPAPTNSCTTSALMLRLTRRGGAGPPATNRAGRLTAMAAPDGRGHAVRFGP